MATPLALLLIARAAIPAELDHVMIAVSDLNSGAASFQAAGFEVKQGGKFPDGVENRAIRFENGTYLELLAIYDQHKSGAADLVEFLKTGPGSLGYGLTTASAEKAMNILKDHGEDVVLEATTEYDAPGRPKTNGWLWKDVYWKNVSPAGDPFFIEYAKPRSHAAKKSGLKGVLVAVKDLNAATAQYSKFAAVNSKVRIDPEWNAEIREARVGAARVYLMHPVGPGPVQRFVDAKGNGTFGVVLSDSLLKSPSLLVEGLWLESETRSKRR